MIRGSGSTSRESELWKSPSSADGKVVEKRGGNGAQTVRAFQAPKRLNKPNLFPTGCHRLPSEWHGKQGVCRGLPPLAGGPLSEKEGVESRTLGRLVRGAGGPRESLLHHYAMSAIRARACTCLVRQDGAEAHRARGLARARSRSRRSKTPRQEV